MDYSHFVKKGLVAYDENKATFAQVRRAFIGYGIRPAVVSSVLDALTFDKIEIDSAAQILCAARAA